MADRFTIKAKGDKAEVLIYEDIGDGWYGGVSAKGFADDVKKLGNVKEIFVRINSYGGSVFDGLAIYNTLKNHKATITVNIDGIAASIASIIAMAGDEINIAANGFMMIHDPWTIAAGTAEDLRAEAEIMEKVRGSLLDTYMLKASVERDVISNLMAAETWLTAEEAATNGLVTNITDEVKLAACANIELLKKFKHIPINLIPEEKPRVENHKLKYAKMNQVLQKRKL